MTSHAAVIRGIIKYLKKNRIWHLKLHGSSFQRSGVLDIQACNLGKTIFIEVKMPDDDLSELQLLEIKNLLKAGIQYAVVGTVAEGIAAIGWIENAGLLPIKQTARSHAVLSVTVA